MTPGDFRTWIAGLAEAEATIPARVVLERLPDQEMECADLSKSTELADLTAEEVAEYLGRTAACVRGWCREEKLEGSYRLNQREWRIPRESLRAYLDVQAKRERAGPTRPRPPNGEADLSAWREEIAT